MKELSLNQSYGKLYEKAYKGECEVFEYQSSLGTVKHLFMKRKVPHQIDGAVYYDLITPFTYGGPVIEAACEENRWELINEFQEAFQNYCLENNIVSEFVRFHPLLLNSIDFLHCYELDYIEDSQVINIAGCVNPIAESFSAENISKVLEAFRQGLDYEIHRDKDKTEDLTRFFNQIQRSKTCHSTGYFAGCKEIMEEQLLFIEVKYDGKIVGMTMCLLLDKVLTTHILLTSDLGDSLDAIYVMHYGLTVWSRNNGIEMIHLAGEWVGKSKEEIAEFKNHFSKVTDFKYCIGRKIWNEEIYAQLCERVNVGMYIDYFPAYRVGENERGIGGSRKNG